MGMTGEKSILLLVEFFPSSGSPRYVAEKVISVYFDSRPFERFNMGLTTMTDGDTRYAFILIFYFVNRYNFNSEAPFGVFMSLLREGGPSGKSQYRNEKVWTSVPIEGANIYLIYDRRKGPDKSETLLREILELSNIPVVSCRGINPDVFWGTVNEDVFGNRLKARRALDFLQRVTMGLAASLPYIGPIFQFNDPIMELLGLAKERPLPRLNRIYSQFFDYSKYVIEPYIFIGVPECGSVSWIGIVTKLKFTYEYNEATITAIGLINNYYYYGSSVRLNIG